MSDTPTHIVARGDSERTYCGIKVKDKAALPYVVAEFVQAHIDGHGMVVCAECSAVAGGVTA